MGAKLNRIRSRLTYANVMSTIAAFIALSGGTAYAVNEWTGANIVDSSLTNQDLAPSTITATRIAADAVGTSEIENSQVMNADLAANAITASRIAADAVGTSEIENNQVMNADLAGNSITSSRVAADTLTGDDIDEANVSGLDRCPAGTSELGRLCVAAGVADFPWFGAANHCEGQDLRLPTLSEARTLGDNHDIPDVGDTGDAFWTSDIYQTPTAAFNVFLAVDTDDGNASAFSITTLNDTGPFTVCVTTPQN